MNLGKFSKRHLSSLSQCRSTSFTMITDSRCVMTRNHAVQVGLIFLIFIESIYKGIFFLFNAGIEAYESHNEKLHVKDITFDNVKFTFTAKLDRS